MAPMYGNGGGGKAARATKKIAKVAEKAVKRMDSGKDAGKVLKRMAKAGASASDFASAAVKSMAKPAKEKGISLKERAKGLAAAKGLAKLDVLQKPLKAAARKQLIKSQMKGK